MEAGRPWLKCSIPIRRCRRIRHARPACHQLSPSAHSKSDTSTRKLLWTPERCPIEGGIALAGPFMTCYRYRFDRGRRAPKSAPPISWSAPVPGEVHQRKRPTRCGLRQHNTHQPNWKLGVQWAGPGKTCDPGSVTNVVNILPYWVSMTATLPSASANQTVEPS
jgi:hypothetical protein